MRIRTPAAPLAVLALACGAGVSLDRPPEIRYGVDECSFCRMIVSDPRHGGAAFTAAGEPLRFDDLGCLAAALSERGEPATRAWVRTGGPSGWTRGEEARIVRFADRPTPMGSGLVAFATEPEARAAAAGAPLLRLSDLLAPAALPSATSDTP